jgi:hypothetical protein
MDLNEGGQAKGTGHEEHERQRETRGAEPAGRRRTSRGELGAVCGLYALLALAGTWPLVLHFGSASPGTDWWGQSRIYFETPVNLWNLWWFRHALLELGQSPFECWYLFYPHGASLWFHTLSPLHALLALPLLGVLPLAAVQNVLLVASLTGAGAFTFLLARHLGLQRAGAFLAGTVYALSPPVLAHLYVGHFELLATYWMPASLLLMLRLLDRPAPRLGDGALLGLVLAASAYSSRYYTIYSLELLALAAAVRWRSVLRPGALRALGAGAGVAALGIAPLLAQFLGAGDPSEAPRVNPVDFDLFSGDFLSFFVPSFQHPLLAGLLEPLHRRLTIPGRHLPQESTMYLGLCVLALAALGCRRWQGSARTRLLLLGIAGVFWLQALGSRLKVGGMGTGLPLPAALLQHVPLVRLARAPGRHVVLTLLGLAILAGAGWQTLGRAWMRRAAAGLIALEYAAVPLPLFRTEVPAVYERLAAEPGRFAVLELPFGLRDGTDSLGQPSSEQIFAQTVHARPILGGMVSRLPPRTWRSAASAPVAGTLLHPRGVTEEALRRDLQQGPEYFRRWRIRAVVVHPEARRGPQQAYVERVLPVERREAFPDGSELLWLRLD